MIRQPLSTGRNNQLRIEGITVRSWTSPQGYFKLPEMVIEKLESSTGTLSTAVSRIRLNTHIRTYLHGEIETIDGFIIIAIQCQ